MKTLLLSVGAALSIAAAGVSATAQGNGWNGQWKADPASMKYMGPQFMVVTDAAGYTVTRDGTPTKIVCDGNPQKTDSTMTSCTKSGDTYVLDVTRDDKHVRNTKISLSADGNTRTTESNVTPSDGSKPYTLTTSATRISGKGMDGEWRETKFRSSEDNGIVSIQVNGDMVAFKETDYPAPVDCKLDGTETKLGDGTVAVKLAAPRTLKVTYRGDGKIRRENTFVLSADGKKITETDVTPAPGASTMVITLHKM